MSISRLAIPVLVLLAAAVGKVQAGVMSLRLEDVTAAISAEDSVTGTSYATAPTSYDVWPSYDTLGGFSIGFTTLGTSTWTGSVWGLHLHIDVTNASTETRTFKIQFTSTDFGPIGSGDVSSGIGGLVTAGSGATIQFTEAIDPSNQVYGMPGNANTYTYGLITPTVKGDFSANQLRASIFSGSSTFSLTQEITISDLAPGESVSFDSFSQIPEPSSAPVVGLVVVVVAGLVLRPMGKHDHISEEYLASLAPTAG